jgi:hypothetical protein
MKDGFGSKKQDGRIVGLYNEERSKPHDITR